MTLLNFEDGRPFASGSSQFLYGPDSRGGKTSRIQVNVCFEDQPLTAVLDTGAPFVMCNPEIAELIGLTRQKDDLTETIYIGLIGEVAGYLKRMNVLFVADAGQPIEVDATAFIPILDENDAWDSNFPSFIGLSGCLERMRFAIDPLSNRMYFGAGND